MSLKTFFTRSFELYAADGNGSSELSLVNAHHDVEVTDVHVELELSEHLRSEKTSFDLGTLSPGQKVSVTTLTSDSEDGAKNHNVKAKISGRVGGEDLDRETLVAEATF